MKQIVYIFFGWLLTVVASWCAGKLLLRRLRINLYRQEQDVMAFMLGSAALSTSMFLLSATHLVYKPVLLSLTFLVISAAVQQGVWRPGGPELPGLPPKWRLLFWGIYLAFAVLYLVFALAPESSPDGSTYHLGLVARYEREHGFSAITNNFFASLPQGMELLFLFAFVWGRHSAAALVHCTYLLLLPFLILNYGRRLGMPGVGVVGGLLIFLAPVAGAAGASAYNDVALAAVSFGVFSLLEIWIEERQPALLVAIGILAGFAFAIKYTGFVALPYAMACVAYQSWRARKAIFRPVLLVTLSAAVFISPTLLKNWIVVRNPVSPFLNRVFPNPYVHVAFEEELAAKTRSYDVHSIWELVSQVTMRGDKTQGVLGPIFLLAPFSLLALRRATGRRLLLVTVVFLLPYPSNLGTRFLLPAATFLAPAIATGLGGGIGLAMLVVVHAFLSWPSHVHWYCARYAWRLDEIPVRAALRVTAEEEYLLQHLGANYEIARLIEYVTPPGSKIYSIDVPPQAYCAREILPYFYSAFNRRLFENLCTPFEGRLQPLRTLTFRFVPRTLTGLRLVQTGAQGAIVPTLHEMRVYGPGGELQRQSAWRINAHPFPWDVGLAFDRNPATRWSAWQEMARGSWISVEFDREETISSVKLETSDDQAAVRWNVEGESTPGNWFALNASGELGHVAAPPDLRKAAIEQLKLYHIQYLLVEAGFASADFRDHAREWGIRPIGESQGIRLYQLE